MKSHGADFSEKGLLTAFFSSPGKRRVIVSLMLSLLFISGAQSPVRADSGTWMLGGKLWYAAWHSYVSYWFKGWMVGDPAVEKVSVDPGYGVLYGPIGGYKPAYGNWAVSGALMFGDFEQDVSFRFNDEPKKAVIELQRRDIDLAVSWSIGDYWKVFAGYKSQQYDMEFRAETLQFNWHTLCHIPTVGAGVVFPLGETTSIGFQLGFLYVITYAEYDGREVEIDDGIGFNGEILFSWMPAEKFVLQAGYRFQMFTVEGEDESGLPMPWETDMFHGITLAGVYLF